MRTGRGRSQPASLTLTTGSPRLREIATTRSAWSERLNASQGELADVPRVALLAAGLGQLGVAAALALKLLLEQREAALQLGNLGDALIELRGGLMVALDGGRLPGLGLHGRLLVACAPPALPSRSRRRSSLVSSFISRLVVRSSPACCSALARALRTWSRSNSTDWSWPRRRSIRFSRSRSRWSRGGFACTATIGVPSARQPRRSAWSWPSGRP